MCPEGRLNVGFKRLRCFCWVELWRGSESGRGELQQHAEAADGMEAVGNSEDARGI